MKPKYDVIYRINRVRRQSDSYDSDLAVFYNLKLTHHIKIITPKPDHLLLCIRNVEVV